MGNYSYLTADPYGSKCPWGGENLELSRVELWPGGAPAWTWGAWRANWLCRAVSGRSWSWHIIQLVKQVRWRPEQVIKDATRAVHERAHAHLRLELHVAGQ